MSNVTAIANAREKAEAALQNERVTRHRLDQFNQWIDLVAPIIAAHEDFTQMSFWERLRWLMTGAIPVRDESKPMQPSSR